MTALFVSYSGVLGGAERSLVDVAAGIGRPAIVACPEGLLAAASRNAGLTHLALHERPLELRGGARERLAAARHLAGHVREVGELLASLRPELLYAWSMRSALACAAATRRGRAEGALLIDHHELLPGPAVGRALASACRRAERVTVPSTALRDELVAAGVPAARIEVIARGVDLDALVPVPLPETPATAIVGALVGWKRPQLGLEAVALARRELPALRLHVAGAPLDGPGEALLKRLRQRAAAPDLDGAVTFHAAAADVSAVLAQCGCLLHCADREPFGRVLVEAMACGRAVVAAEAGGPLDIVDARSGLLYQPGDPAAAAAALVAVLGDPDRTAALGAGARARAEGRFGLGAMRKRHRELADGLAPRQEPGAESRPGTAVTLVTVTHSSEAELGALLASVERFLPAARVIVADSGSTDRSAAVAREAGAEVLELGENVGFGRANNAALALVRTPVTILLNPDTELLDGSLALLAGELLRPGAPDRILAPLVLLPDGSRQDSAQLAPGTARAVLTALVPPAALPGRLARPAAPWRSQTPRRIGWAVGCCLAAHTETLRRLGPFDERIFLYGEDMDLGLRAARAGVETWFWPQARVLHHRAHSTRPAFGGENFELLAEQRRAVIGRALGPGAQARDDALQALTFADRIMLKRLTGRSTERERRQLEALKRARGG